MLQQVGMEAALDAVRQSVEDVRESESAEIAPAVRAVRVTLDAVRPLGVSP